uniref:T9SS type A sorting domain-containing protein n=1 Tax=candidate division WOR-3 bacterium TaxID=2052148 RepID=A0A7C4XL25_UNCW3
MLNHPGRIAAIDVHYPQGDSFFLQEGYDRIHYYPPPFYGMYIPPWLWYDGNQHGGFDYAQWESMIVNRMNQPAPVTIHLDGEYSPWSNSGTIYATFINDSTATINGRVIIVITEDSLFYPAPNGTMWHCNVPRDYIPDDSGITVSIPSGDSVTISMPFSTHPNWNKFHCKIKTWIQNDIMQADSTKEIWQGAMVNLLEIGIKEEQTSDMKDIQILPNPCISTHPIQFNLPYVQDYQITIFDCAGGIVNKFSINAARMVWNLKDANGNQIPSGVYYYCVVSKRFKKSGKIVVLE